MFQEVKSMLPVSGDAYDGEIVLQIKAAAKDLTRTAEIVMPGVIDITFTEEPLLYETGEPIRDEDTGEILTKTVAHDNSTVTDELMITTIATWCAARIGNPPNYDKLVAAYESLKGSMRVSSDYTDYEATEG